MSNTQNADTLWKELAATIGFESEVAMWQKLYVDENRSINDLSKTLGYGTATVQRRLRLSGVQRKGRGGAHTPSKVYYKMFHLDQRFVRLADVEDLIQLCDASSHSVYRVRKEL